MATTTTRMRIDDLRRIVAGDAAGLSDAQLAAALNAEGVPGPRHDPGTRRCSPARRSDPMPERR